MDEKEFYQTAGGVLQPNKIIIETRNFVAQGMTYATDNISILSNDCSDEILGSWLLKHLDRSRQMEIMNQDYRELRKSYLRKSKFRSEPSFKQNARFVTIFKTIDSLMFRPYENKISDGRWGSFSGIPNETFEIFGSLSKNEIGMALRKAWLKCIFT